MGIKSLLAQQDATFISINDLLQIMCAANDCSLEEAAIALHRLLSKEQNPPNWFCYSKVDGIASTSMRDNNPMRRLRYVADNGAFESDIDEIPF